MDTPTQRAKRYRIDIPALALPSKLGTIDPDNGTHTVWDPLHATEYLTALQMQPGFDVERYCKTCESYDQELAIRPDQKRLPRFRPEKLRQLMKEPVALPWEGGKPAADVHVKEKHKVRPSRPTCLDACHNCLISFLDEQEPPELTGEQMARLKAAFQEARAEVSRLHQSRARESRADVLDYTERLLQRANTRLTIAVNACRDAGFEPFRPRVRRDGEDAPDQVVATELELAEFAPMVPA